VSSKTWEIRYTLHRQRDVYGEPTGYVVELPCGVTITGCERDRNKIELPPNAFFHDHDQEAIFERDMITELAAMGELEEQQGGSK
jgi:hypothetical protein